MDEYESLCSTKVYLEMIVIDEVVDLARQVLETECRERRSTAKTKEGSRNRQTHVLSIHSGVTE